MRAWSRLLILLNLGSLFLFCSAAVADSIGLKISDLTKPDRVIEYLKSAPKERKKMAEHSYQYAFRQSHRMNLGVSWGSVAKPCLESLMDYPMGKAFLLCAESNLKDWDEAKKENSDWVSQRKSRLARKALERAYGWLNTAIAVESYERSMPDDQRAKLVPYRDCVKRYLDTGKAEPSCVPLQWSGDVSAP